MIFKKMQHALLLLRSHSKSKPHKKIIKTRKITKQNATSKTKMSAKNKTANKPVLWSFASGDNNNKWSDLHASDAAKVEEAYQLLDGKGEATVVLNGGTTYLYNFDKMTQQNLESMKVRNLRRTDPNKKDKPGNELADGSGDADEDDPFAADPKKQHKADKGADTKPSVKGKSGDLKDAAASKAKKNAAAGGEGKFEEGGEPQYGKVTGNPFHGSGDSSFAAGGGKLILKGRGCVDGHCAGAATKHVVERGDIVYQVMLNQVELDGKNSNKFYVIQCLADDNPASAVGYVFTRWGRVGVDGQQKLEKFNTVDMAIKNFNKRFYEKTANTWDGVVAGNFDKFIKKPDKYQLMKIDLGATAAAASSSDDAGTGAAAAAVHALAQKKEVMPCALPPALKTVMELISSKKEMTRAMAELEIDVERMPLGVISKAQIKDAFAILRNIEEELNEPHLHKDTHRSILLKETSSFYTLIPHAYKVSVKPPTIDSVDMLKKKMDLLDMLSNIEVATKMLNEKESSSGAAAEGDETAVLGEDGKKVESNKIRHPLDSTFSQLKVKMNVMPRDGDVFRKVERYMTTTHAPTHTNYTLTLNAVLAVERPEETARFEPYRKKGLQRQMLWHGSRLGNIYGILATGLRIAPPEAPCTGYMFGKALYHTQVCSKSANYCHAGVQQRDGFLLLCEVAVGTPGRFTEAKYMDKAQKGTDSTLGVGRYTTEATTADIDNEGVIWPMGPLIDTKNKNTALLYDEMMVYDVAQCRIRYLVHCTFNFVN